MNERCKSVFDEEKAARAAATKVVYPVNLIPQETDQSDIGETTTSKGILLEVVRVEKILPEVTT